MFTIPGLLLVFVELFCTSSGRRNQIKSSTYLLDKLRAKDLFCFMCKMRKILIVRFLFLIRADAVVRRRGAISLSPRARVCVCVC